MIQRPESGEEPTLTSYGYLVYVPVVVGGPHPDKVSERLVDGLLWLEGCGQPEVTFMGEMELDDDGA